MKYIINGTMTVSCQTVVYAESEEEALEIADAREPALLGSGLT